MLVSVAAEKGNRVADRNAVYIANVNYHLVHANPADNFGSLTFYKHAAVLCKGSLKSVGVTDRNGGHRHVFRRRKGTSVAYIHAFFKAFYHRNYAFKLHRRHKSGVFEIIGGHKSV